MNLKLVPVFSIVLFASACGSSVVPAHELEVALDYDGLETSARIAFPEVDAEANRQPGDDTCELFSGNCGYLVPTEGIIEGSSPIVRAQMTVIPSSLSRTYDLYIERSAADEAEYSEQLSGIHQPQVVCRVYDTELGEPHACYHSTRSTQVILRARALE